MLTTAPLGDGWSGDSPNPGAFVEFVWTEKDMPQIDETLFRAKCDYTTKERGELSLTQGDLVRAIDPPVLAWVLVQKLSTRERGYVSLDSLEPVHAIEPDHHNSVIDDFEQFLRNLPSSQHNLTGAQRLPLRDEELHSHDMQVPSTNSPLVAPGRNYSANSTPPNQKQHTPSSPNHSSGNRRPIAYSEDSSGSQEAAKSMNRRRVLPPTPELSAGHAPSSPPIPVHPSLAEKPRAHSAESADTMRLFGMTNSLSQQSRKIKKDEPVIQNTSNTQNELMTRRYSADPLQQADFEENIAVLHQLDFSSTDSSDVSRIQSPIAQQETPSSCGSVRTRRALPPKPNIIRMLNSDSHISIVVSTWNVGSRVFSRDPMELREWLHVDKGPADIHVLALQEIEMSKSAMMKDLVVKESTAVKHDWEYVFQRVLERGASNEPYTMICSEQLVGIHLCIFARQTISSRMEDIRMQFERVGVGGVLGNKGAVACRLKLFGISLCFINAHLSAHTSALAIRNQNIHDILRHLNFDPSSMNHSNGRSSESVSYAPAQHDVLFFFGDLNYRITEISFDEVLDKIGKNRWSFLRRFDQLTREKNASRIFQGYQEGELSFPPSYKYQVQSDYYDSKRVPSWTDRILWKTNSRGMAEVEQQFYGRHEIFMSDHRPVSAAFRVRRKNPD